MFIIPTPPITDLGIGEDSARLAFASVHVSFGTNIVRALKYPLLQMRYSRRLYYRRHLADYWLSMLL